MNKLVIALCTATAALALAIPDADAQGRAKARGAYATPDGGIAAGRLAGARGPNGSGYLRGRSLDSDGQGNGTLRRGGVYRGPNDGVAARSGSTTRSADGSLQHDSGARWNTPRGSGSTQAEAARSADGTWSGARTTTASGTQGGQFDASTSFGGGSAQRSVDATGKNGYRYEADVTATKGEGVTRTATCYDPSGNVVACRR